MKVKLVFTDWRRDGISIYNTEEGVRLTAGDLHSGSTFHGDFMFDSLEVEQEIAKAWREAAAYPVFEVRPDSQLRCGDCGGLPR